MNSKLSSGLAGIAVLTAAGLLVGCGAHPGGGDSATNAAGKGDKVTITNCGEQKTMAKPQRIMANDGNNIAIALAAGADQKLVATSSLKNDRDLVAAKYGDRVNQIPEVTKEYPGLEQILGAKPDLYMAGWGYGFGEANNVTPDTLKSHGVESYLLTESCRNSEKKESDSGKLGTGKSRGIEEPWQAVRDDLGNMGKLLGTEDQARKVIEDQDARLGKLHGLPQPGKKPTGFIFDSAKDKVYTSGKFGAPQAILESAGARNGTEGIADTWTDVSWEKIVESKPDFFVMVDNPSQTFEEKVQLLKTNQATKDLPAVKEDRFINLPYTMWVSGPFNIDAAEHVRKGLEMFGLVPHSDLHPQLQVPHGKSA